MTVKSTLPLLLILLLQQSLTAQKAPGDSSNKKLNYVSFAFTNNNSAYPFAAFSSLVYKEWHPGFEVGTGFNWKVKKKHDWYQEFRFGYFYHQFIQHGIPLYTSFGYRYKFSKRWNAQAGLGAGYFHSIPDHDRFKLDDNGEYKKITNIGRAQAMVVLNLSAGYSFALDQSHPMQAFITYQQRIQTPFVQNYVPLLPYNTLMLGIKRSIKGRPL